MGLLSFIVYLSTLTSGPDISLAYAKECLPRSYGNTLDGYCDSLQNHYKTIEALESPRIVDIQLMKTANPNFFHEYIIARVVSSAQPRAFVHLIVERGKGPPPPPGFFDKFMATPPEPELPPHCIEGGSPCCCPRHAVDRVLTANHRNGVQHREDQVVGYMDFPSKPLYLHQLALLASTLHDYEPYYSLQRETQYWFTGAIANALALHYQIKLEDAPPRDKGSLSCWNSYKEPSDEALQALLDAYVTNVDIFEAKIRIHEKLQRISN